MTREEAMKTIESAKHFAYDDIYEEAFDIAIKALEQEPITKNDLGVDAISRIETIDYLCKHCPDDGECFKDCDEIKHLRNLPSVTPQEPISDILEDIYFDIEKEYKDCVIGKLDDDEMYPCFRQITDIYGLLDIIGKYIDKYKAESESQKSEEA